MAWKMRERMRSSSSTLAARMTSLRAHSSSSMTTYTPRISSVSMASVVWLRLLTTRPYTSSI